MLFSRIILLLSVFYSINNDFSDPFSVFTCDLSIRFQHVEPVIIQPSLVAHWALDEGSGYECIDWSGNKLTAYITGHNWNTYDSGLTSSFRKKGKRAGAIYLNGSQWLQVQNRPGLNPNTGFIISLWIKPYELNESVIIHKTLEHKGYTLSLKNNGSFKFTFFTNDGEEYSVKSSADICKLNSWQQIVVIADMAAGSFKILHNNSIVGEKEEHNINLAYSWVDFCIGGSPLSRTCYKGLIDEISIFNTKLDDKEICENYTSGLPKIYRQTRETINNTMTIWNWYHGNSPIPHPNDVHSKMIFRYNNSVTSLKGEQPLNEEEIGFKPCTFGAALNARILDRGLCYNSPYAHNSGTFEAWINLSNLQDIETPLFRCDGKRDTLEIGLTQDMIKTIIRSDVYICDTITVSNLSIPSNRLVHVALSWRNKDHSTRFRIFLNGVEVGEKRIPTLISVNEKIWIGGNSQGSFAGLIDDVYLSDYAKHWGEICPRGHVDTESPALDLMLDFNYNSSEPLMHWTTLSGQNRWIYGKKSWDSSGEGNCILQSDTNGIKTLYHPDAFGFNSSFESSVAVDEIQNAWLGVFVQSPEVPGGSFSGNTFTINFLTCQTRLATYSNGKIISEKILLNDFEFKPEQNYLLTLSSIDGILRGYIDGRNTISIKGDSKLNKGYAGLFTINGTAFFDDIHFSALTPSNSESRKIANRLIADNENISYNDFSLNAFRWKKRYGLLPWQRDYKNPEPPGNIFGPDNETTRPNPSNQWRSEDAANSAVILVDGTFLYFMRGNPVISEKHGNAQIGVLWTEDKNFDAIHFTDPSFRDSTSGKIWILKGHRDTNKEGCNDKPPRDKRFQLNDEGCVYIDGKVLVLCREFRNRNSKSEIFRRVVMGIFDVSKRSWTEKEPVLMDWSRMNPDSCYAKFFGINATPEITLIRDPQTNEYIVLLFHVKTRTEEQGYQAVTGFGFDGQRLNLHPLYPERNSVCKHNNDYIYGERILFDNGIWYMNINAHSNKLDRDWPDRFELYTSLDPYEGPWCGSSENTNPEKPYFSRGDEFDPDNGAIWQGAMLKYRNHYYMYYENFHVIDNVEVPYEHYDHLQSGSRVGFAVAN